MVYELRRNEIGVEEKMLEKARRSLQELLFGTGDNKKDNQHSQGSEQGREAMKVLRKGPAMRVIFFYPGEEGTYVDHAEVILYENGIVNISSNQEETTTHLQNCEILWRFETDAEDRANKVRLLKPKASEGRSIEEPPTASSSKSEKDAKHEGKPGKGHHHSSKKNPELAE